MLTRYLFIYEGIHVEVYSFQVQNQVLRRFTDSSLLRNIIFLITKITSKIIYQLAQDKSIERL